MKKLFSAIIPLLLLALAAMIFTACDLAATTNYADTASYTEMHAVYMVYAENGGTLSYDQWLSSVRGGAAGVGIASITKTEEDDDLYTVTYTDGTTAVYSVKDGLQAVEKIAQNVGITKIEQAADGSFTVQYEDGRTISFTIADGGNGIDKIEKTSTDELEVTYTITFSDGTATTFTVMRSPDPDEGNNDEPNGNTEDPNGGNDQPGGDDPNGNTEDPNGGNDEPGNDDPNGNTEDPNGSTDDPNGGNDQPGGNTEEPNNGTDDPNGGNDEPGNDDPNGNNEGPNGGNDDPGNDDPTGNNDQPGGNDVPNGENDQPNGNDEPENDDPNGNTEGPSGGNDEPNEGYEQPGGDDPNGNTEEPPMVLVPDAPILSATINGITWDEVQNATHYLVTVNGGEAQKAEERFIALVAEAGDYVVRVRALNGETEGKEATFTYRAAAVALSELSADKLTATWTATALSVTFTVNGERATFVLTGDTYSYTAPSAAGTYALSVTATGGYDANNAVYYFGDSVTNDASVTVSTLAAPILSVGDDGITWDAVQNAVGYEVRIDNGAWTKKTDRNAAFSSSAKRHVVKVRAISDDPLYLTSEEASFAYVTETLALSALSMQKTTASWSASALSLTLTVNGENAEYVLSDGTYSHTVPSVAGTYTLSVTAVGGYDETNAVYYVGTSLSKDAEITVSALDTPVLSAAISGVSWTTVDGATTYLVSVDGDDPKENNYLSVLLRTAEGTHTVSVQAVPSDPIYAASDTATYTYTTAAATLTDFATNGLTVTWKATGKVTLTVDGVSAVYTLSDGVYSYTCTGDEDSYDVKVNVKSAYVDTTYYYAATTLERAATLSVQSLAMPVLSATESGVTWAAVTNAAAYKVSLDNGNWNETTDRIVPLDTAIKSHSVRVIAISDDRIHTDSSMAQFFYVTKSVELPDLSVNGRSASWTPTALSETFTVNGKTAACDISDGTHSYTAPAMVGTYALSVTVTDGYDSKNAVYYVGNSVTKGTSITVSALAAPALSANANGIYWNNVPNATAYKVRVDAGAWNEKVARSEAFSSSTGDHVVKVYAISDDTSYLQSAEATFNYETIALYVSELSKNERKVSWTMNAVSYTFTVNGNNTGPALEGGVYSYTCPATVGTYALSLSASTYYDSANNRYYYTREPYDRTDSVTVSTLSAPSLSASTEGVSWDAVSNAAYYQYSIDGGSSWTDTSDMLVAFDTENGAHTVKVKAVGAVNSASLTSSISTYSYTTAEITINNFSRSGRNISWTATANTLSVKRGNTTLSATKNGDTYTVSNAIPASSGTYSFTVSSSTHWDGNNRKYYYAASTVTSTLSVSVSQLAAPVLSTPSAGATTISWNAVDHATGYEYSTNGGSSWSSASGRSSDLSASTGTHSLCVRAISSDPIYLASAATSDFTYYSTPVSLSNVTFSGITAHWTASARYVQVKEDSGSYANTTLSSYELTSRTAGSHTVSVKAYGGYDASKNIFYSGSAIEKSQPKSLTLANTTLTFEDQTANSPYTVANGGSGAQYWTQQYENKSNESWVNTSNQMNSRYGDTSRVVNMSTSTVVGRFTYSTGSSLGLANSFNVRLGNYYTSYDIWYKIMLIDTAGNTHYITGAANKYVKIVSTGTNNSNKVFTTVNYIGFDPIEVQAIRFDVYGTTGNASTYCYLYLDDLSVSYVDTSASSAGQYKGDGSSYKGTTLTVSAGEYMTKDLSAGYANKVAFTLTNASSSDTTYTDLTLYDEDYMVATGRYVLYANQSQGYTLLFDKCKVTKFMISVASAAGVKLSNMTFSEDSTYETDKDPTYRVPISSGTTSIKIMGANEVKSNTTLSINPTAIKQLQTYAADVSPLFSYIAGVKAIISATYAQSTNILTNSNSNDTYGTLTIKYLENGSDTLTTSTVTVKRKAVASINNNDSGQSTREYYARNLYKDIAIDPHGLILCGSSSMEKWETYSQDMKGIDVADVGIGGTASTDWIVDGGLAERLIYAYNPRAIILFVGVNDLKYNSSVDTTLSNVKTLIQQIHTNLPHTKVFYVLINKVPLAISGSNKLTVKNVESFNNSMSSYAASYSWLYTISLDTTNRMVYSESGTGDLTSFADGMHLNKAGYTEWAYVMRKTFLEND